ncbi:hypothetical protein F4778DRAFT_703758 [Xylariomycetidae sp. FL2044]|nr:hypothetical protein F4778DRAFT_703758 [Xylariomycetidae sp. FL2044]
MIDPSPLPPHPPPPILLDHNHNCNNHNNNNNCTSSTSTTLPKVVLKSNTRTTTRTTSTTTTTIATSDYAFCKPLVLSPVSPVSCLLSAVYVIHLSLFYGLSRLPLLVSLGIVYSITPNLPPLFIQQRPQQHHPLHRLDGPLGRHHHHHHHQQHYYYYSLLYLLRIPFRTAPQYTQYCNLTYLVPTQPHTCRPAPAFPFPSPSPSLSLSSTPTLFFLHCQLPTASTRIPQLLTRQTLDTPPRIASTLSLPTH